MIKYKKKLNVAAGCYISVAIYFHKDDKIKFNKLPELNVKNILSPLKNKTTGNL